MNNKSLKLLLLIGAVGASSQTLAAAWQTECSKLKDIPNACNFINDQVKTLTPFMPPPPFLAFDLNVYPPNIFPGGVPWTNAGGGGTSGYSGSLPVGGSTPSSDGGFGGDSSGASGGGAWQ